MQRGTAHAPTRLVAVTDRVLAFEDEGPARRLYPTSPNVGVDQVGELPVRALLEHDDTFALPRQNGSVDRARCAGPDNDDVDFFIRPMVTTSCPARYEAC